MLNNKLVVLLCLLLMILIAGPAAFAKQSETPLVVSRITPAPEHVNLDRTITNLLSYYHYRRSKPDDNQSSAILDS
jgi:hypothetical protein